MTKAELVEIALKLRKNVDEAEQLSDYIDDLIRHCDKSFLIIFIESLISSVEYNIESGDRENVIVDDKDELIKLIEYTKKKI